MAKIDFMRTLYKLTFFSLMLLCVSCQNQVVRQVRVLPVYQGYAVMTAVPAFSSNGLGEDYNVKYNLPYSWKYSRSSEGVVSVIWKSYKKSREKLLFKDSGFHPVSIDTSNCDQTGNNIDLSKKPPLQRVEFLGTNSAFIREHIKLKKLN